MPRPSLIRQATEELIRKLKANITPHTILVPDDDVFEVTNTPSLILQGPKLEENRARRCAAAQISRDEEGLTFEERFHPRYYHLDFQLIATTRHEGDLLDLQESMAAFYQSRSLLCLEAIHFDVTQIVPLGGLRRLNLSDLRQSAGTLRIEDVPIYGGPVTIGKLIQDRVFDFNDQERRLPREENS